MAWDKVDTTRPPVAYAVVGFALLLFGLISLFMKQKLYIGEATVATIYGLIVGPHCLNWFAPITWGNTDEITFQLCRIVLVVQIFAVAVELPKKYMLRHWWSITMLLVPVMTWGWVISSVFIWKLVPTLRWIEALCIAGCVTATDPVLAAAVVGKGKFAQRVPGHIRNLLSAESGCNDGMAYPFVIMAVEILLHEHHPAEIAKEFIVVGILYSCVFGVVLGAVIGYLARHLIKLAEKFDLIDRESFLVYYFCVALFCAGVGTIVGADELLVAFAAGAAFSWDGWFAKQTEESHVSDVIDVLLNTAFFVYFGSIVPWTDFNNDQLGIKAWKLVIIAIIILVVRRIPIMLMLKPVIPDIKTWREASFCGHFGPIGVGGLYMAILARAEFETNSEHPLKDLPTDKDSKFYYVIHTVWPITCFLVITSIIVHGSSVAMFTLGKHINRVAITMTYTTGGGNGPSWLSRLPTRASEGGGPLRLEQVETEYPLRNGLRNRRKFQKKPRPSETLDLQAPPSERAHGHSDTDSGSTMILLPLELSMDFKSGENVSKTDMVPASRLEGHKAEDIRAYVEGPHVVVEDEEGNYVHKFELGEEHGDPEGEPHLKIHADKQQRTRSVSEANNNNVLSRATSLINIPRRPGQHVYAYMNGDDVVLENDEGEIVKRYRYRHRGTAEGRNDHRVGKGFSKWLPHLPWSKPGRVEDHQMQDVESSPEAELEPVEAPGEEKSLSRHFRALSNVEDRELREKLKSMIERGELPEGEPTSGSDHEGSQVKHSNDELALQSDDEEEPETEVERSRRLAALGGIRDDDDDEIEEQDEDEPTPPQPAASAGAPDDDEPKITFQLPRRH